MANIEKRGDSYRITVSCGYNIAGKKNRASITWKPEKGMTEKQIAKELERQVVLLEEKHSTTQCINGNVTFKAFTEKWLNVYAEKQLRPRTVARYKSMLPRIYMAMGHIKLEKLQPHHLMEFYNNLEESGIRQDTKYIFKYDLGDIIKERGMTRVQFANLAGIETTTVRAVIRKEKVYAETADKISKTLGLKRNELFDSVATNGGSLSSKTVMNYHRLISSILTTAVQWQVIFSNPCERVKAPKVRSHEPKFLDEIEAAHMVRLLDHEPIQYRTMILTLLFTGLRRGELLGLEWRDIDFEKKLMSICRSTLYIAERGIFDDDTKNATSKRVIKLPDCVIDILKAYKDWQEEEMIAQGDAWGGSNKIFTTNEGKALHPDTLSGWFKAFVIRNNLGNISLHSLRHTNATLQIAGGVPITTVASRLGHATPTTTTRIYAHAIKTADEAAADTLQNILIPFTKKEVKQD